MTWVSEYLPNTLGIVALIVSGDIHIPMVPNKVYKKMNPSFEYPADGGLMNVETITQIFLLQTQRRVHQEQEQFINHLKASALVGGTGGTSLGGNNNNHCLVIINVCLCY